MANFKISPTFAFPVIDAPATSKKLKALREKRKISIAQIQKLFGMENPQSIYIWEDEKEKFLPRLDNLVVLAKLYKVSIDEMIVTKLYKVSIDEMIVTKMRPSKEDRICSRREPPYGIAQETLDFIAQNANAATIQALEEYFGCGIIPQNPGSAF